MTPKTAFTLLLFALVTAAGCDATAQKTFCFMEVNAENLFDAEDDPAVKDDAFLPRSPRSWTWHKYWNKLNNLCKVVAAAGYDAPPDAIALCEVENDSVMTDITRRSALRRVGYDYVMTHGADVRGMNVAFVYNPLTFKLLAHESIRPDFSGLPPKTTRDVLHVTGLVLTGDTVDVFVCHLPSRLDRRRQGKEYRARVARQIRAKTDSLLRVRKNGNVIITGDFNDTPADATLRTALGAEMVKADVGAPLARRLYNISAGKKAAHGIKGTYYYKGEWEMLDNFVVSGRLLSREAKFRTTYDNCRIFAAEFLLKEENGVFSPRRTYRGYRYDGGFSDHLPVVVRFDYHSW